MKIAPDYILIEVSLKEANEYYSQNKLWEDNRAKPIMAELYHGEGDDKLVVIHPGAQLLLMPKCEKRLYFVHKSAVMAGLNPDELPK